MALIVLVVGLASCGRPDSTALDLSPTLSVLAVVEGGPTEAFQLVDAVALRVLAGGSVLHDDRVPFSAGGGGALRVRLHPSRAGTTVDVSATLLAGGAGVFGGGASVLLDATGPTRVELSLSPIVAGIHVDEPVATFTAIGEGAQLGAVAVFATRHAVPGVPLTWSSLSPGILAVSSDGFATALAEGEAEVRVTGGGASGAGTVVVRPQVASVTIEPASAHVRVGESFTFGLDVRDRNGNPLRGRQPGWRSLNEGVATVSDGVAVGVGPGQTVIEATVEGVSAQASLSVVALPAAPTDLVGAIVDPVARTYELGWVDNASDETGFLVEMRVENGPWTEAGSVPANATSFQGVGVVGVNEFRVSACHNFGCSDPSNTVTLVFPAPPEGAPELQGLIADARALTYELTWTDDLPDVTRFDLETRVLPGPWFSLGSVSGGRTSYGGTGQPGTNDFRVRACNPYGCGPHSNEVRLFFDEPLSAETLPSDEVVVLRGRVRAAEPYQVAFVFWYDTPQGPYVSWSDWESGSSTQDWYAVVPFAWVHHEAYHYQIVAVDGEGVETRGSVQTVTVPGIVLEKDPEYFEREGSDVTFWIEVPAPAGAPVSPVESVVFLFWHSEGSLTAPAPTVVDEPDRRLFIYSVTRQMGPDLNMDWVSAQARYRTGTLLTVDWTCIEEMVEGSFYGYCEGDSFDAGPPAAFDATPQRGPAPRVVPRPDGGVR